MLILHNLLWCSRIELGKTFARNIIINVGVGILTTIQDLDPIRTEVVAVREFDQIYAFILDQDAFGSQVFVIYA